MKNNYKKGFTLAELLMIFLFISVMLAAFAPIMTRNSKNSDKKIDENCVNGVKLLSVEYQISGTYKFTTPANITGNSIITLVGGGGRGSDATVILDQETGEILSYTTGSGGGGGAYAQFVTSLAQDTEYTIVVGAGGTGENIGQDTVFDSTLSVKGGLNAESVNGGQGGLLDPNSESKAGDFRYGTKGYDGGEMMPGGSGGANSRYSDIIVGGLAGEVCPDSSGVCNPHGKPGNGYERNSSSALGFIAGTGGGGGGVEGSTKTAGVGGMGGSGYAKIEYQVRCE